MKPLHYNRPSSQRLYITRFASLDEGFTLQPPHRSEALYYKLFLAWQSLYIITASPVGGFTLKALPCQTKALHYKLSHQSKALHYKFFLAKRRLYITTAPQSKASTLQFNLLTSHSSKKIVTWTIVWTPTLYSIHYYFNFNFELQQALFTLLPILRTHYNVKRSLRRKLRRASGMSCRESTS